MFRGLHASVMWKIKEHKDKGYMTFIHMGLLKNKGSSVTGLRLCVNGALNSDLFQTGDQKPHS